MRYVSALQHCVPASALSEKPASGRWQLIPYEADGIRGTMVGAASYIDAPDLSLALDASGWHAVYVGYWNPYFAYDGGTLVKVRLSSDPAFRRFREASRCRSQTETSLHEVFFKFADLTGEDLVIGKASGPLGQKAYVAYVKLVPLRPGEVDEVKEDRARSDTRRLVSAIDGMSYFFRDQYTRSEHIRELIEPYRHSDVGTVLWAVNYGDRTNYPSAVGAFTGGKNARARLVQGKGTNGYITGEKAMWESLRSFAARDILPQQVAAEHAHALGLKFDIMFRLGIGGRLLPARDTAENDFLSRHPEFRQVLKNGTAIEKASYAFPEVRDFMLSLIREATEKFDVDGANLCFVRGPHFLSYERPLLEDFEKKYGEDARKVGPSDSRLLELRASTMTEFVRRAREVLDEVGRKKGKRLGLSVWVWPGKRNVWCGRTPMEEGLDVKGWIKADFLDSVICQEGIDEEYIALGKSHGCKFVLFTGYRGDKAMSPRTVATAYRRGVTDFAYWDMDGVQDAPDVWEWLRRLSHRVEMENWSKHAPKNRWAPLKTVGGRNVSEGLQQAAYSGG